MLDLTLTFAFVCSVVVAFPDFLAMDDPPPSPTNIWFSFTILPPIFSTLDVDAVFSLLRDFIGLAPPAFFVWLLFLDRDFFFFLTLLPPLMLDPFFGDFDFFLPLPFYISSSSC